MLAARFNFWLKNDQLYQPYRINSNGGVIWVDPYEFFYAGKSTLNNYECQHSSDHPKGYSAVVDSPCRFLFFDISLFLMKEGEAKFSVGCSLIIFVIFQAFIVYLEFNRKIHGYAAPGEEEGRVDRAENIMQPAQAQHIIEDDATRTIDEKIADFFKIVNPVRSVPLLITTIQQNAHEWLIKYVSTTLINSQQSLVVLPLTNMMTNPYCVQVFTPTGNENAVCLYKYAAYGLPNFFIYGLIAIAGAAATKCCISLTQGGSWFAFVAALFAFLFALGTALCAFISAAFLVFYLFAGVFVGLWFQFGVFYWALQTSRPEFLSISLFIFGEVMWAIIKDAN